MRGTRSTKVIVEKPVEEETFKTEIKEEIVVDDLGNGSLMDDDEANLAVSELLPGPKGEPLYYDGIGYYYNQTSEGKTQRWLQCAHSGCQVSARMELHEGAPIKLLEADSRHDHQPNTSRRERICFLHRLKTRHAQENIPFSVIFQEEAKKNPVGASFFAIDKIEKHLKKKITEAESVPEQEEQNVTPTSRSAMKTRGRPSLLTSEPDAKRKKTSHTPETPMRLSKKLELLKSLQATPTSDSKIEEITVPSERLPGPHPHSFLYHDGQGHFYKALSIADDTRHLKCTTAGCEARARMSLELNAPISLETFTPLHNHPPRPKSNSKTKCEASPAPKTPVVIEKPTMKKNKTPVLSQIDQKKIGGVRKLGRRSIPEKEEEKRVEEEKRIEVENRDEEENNVNVTTQKNKTPALSQIHQKKIGGVRKLGRRSIPEKEEERRVEEENRVVEEDNVEMESFDDIVPVRKCSEKLEGPEYFHDFKGNYYCSIKVKDGLRYLRCLEPTCVAEATMTLQDNAEIRPVPGGRPHNHKPDVRNDYNTKVTQIDSLWIECMPSERLPSLRVQYCCYHDGKGYYYYQASQADNIRYLTCLEARCPARAHMCTRKDAPITLSTLRPPHNHGADLTLRDALLFVDAVRVRSDTPPATAIELETLRNPVGAERVDMKLLTLCLEKAAAISKGKAKDCITEDEVDFAQCVKPAKAVKKVKTSIENYCPVPNHFSSIRSILSYKEDADEKTVVTQELQRQRSERVPALLSNSWLYHDCNGFYYSSKGVHQDKRYLQCVVARCRARGVMALEPGAPIRVPRPHNHGPEPPQHRTELWFFHLVKVRALDEPDTPFAQIYREMALKDPEGAALITKDEALSLMDQLVLCVPKTEDSEYNPKSKKRDPKCKLSDAVHIVSNKPSEKLPSTVFGSGWQYHDGRGYYYSIDKVLKKANVMLLRCVSRQSCPGRATMPTEDGALITMKAQHNHEPDLQYREVCLFSHNVKKRARDEDTSLSVIYAEEAKRFPEAAACMLESKVKRKLAKIRRLVKSQLDVPAEGDEADEDEINYEQENSSEELPGRYKPVYHDGYGYFYQETFSTESHRYLMCVEPQCLAQAKMKVEPRAPLVLQSGARGHNHAPDHLRRTYLLLMDTLRHRVRTQLNQPIESIYDEEAFKEPIVAAQIPKDSLMRILTNIRTAEERGINTKIATDENINQVEEGELWALDVAAERLPSLQHQSWIYHDGRGFYYYSHRTEPDSKKKRLRCCEEGCEARGWLGAGRNASVRRPAGSVLHTHMPDLTHRARLLFLHKVTVRARLQPCAINTIYKEEAQRDPEGAALLPEDKIENILCRLTVNKFFEEMDSDDIIDHEHDVAGYTLNNGERLKELCEVLHSANSDQPVYHDHHGYYYREHRRTQNKQYLVCLTPLCQAQAYLLLADPQYIHVPASSSEHNHESDVFYRNKLVLVQNLRRRVLAETTPISVIYNEEANREPIGADIANDVAIKNMMYKLRKSKNAEITSEDYCDEDFLDSMEEESYVSDNFAVHMDDFKENDEVEDVSMLNNIEDTTEEYGDVEYTEEEYLEEEYTESEIQKPQITSQHPPWKTPKINRPVAKYSSDSLPSEKLPSRSNNVLYHDGMGYYFHFNSVKEKVMYLRCQEPRCKVRAWKALVPENAPIIPTRDSPVHNHQANFIRRKVLLFVHRCKLRAASENLTVNEIWDSEVARDPATATHISASNVKSQMKRYRLEHAANPDKVILSTVQGQNTEATTEDGITFQDASITDFLTNDDGNSAVFVMQDVHQGAVPERIPSLTNESLWHAAGFFYTTYKIIYNIVKGKCNEAGCNARCQIEFKDGKPSTIRLNKNTSHNHSADPHRRDRLLFIDRCKRRAADSSKSVHHLYDEEAARDPGVAAQLSAVRVKRAMLTAKKTDKSKSEEDVDLDDEMELMSESDGDGSADTAPDEIQSECLLCQEDGGLVYHDLGGHFYKEQSVRNNFRFLKCLDCRVAAKMALAPDNAPIIPLDPSVTHNHAPDLNRLNHPTRSPIKNEPECHQKPKPGPKPFRSPAFEVEDSEETQRDAEPESSVDQRYSDFVTLEEESDSHDEQAMNEDDDPDFDPSDDSKLFHDGNGYYFNLVKEKNKRYLRCNIETCGVVVALGPGEKPRHKLFQASPAHKHPPDLLRRKREIFLKRAARTSFDSNEDDSEMDDEDNFVEEEKEVYEIDEEMPQINTKPSELVHGRRPNSYNYHDGNGFYFTSHMLSGNYRYLSCVVNTCKARGYMERYTENAPINLSKQSPAHNHRPDFAFKDFTYFLEKCKMRALEETTPVREIYDQESAIDPVSAGKILKENLIQRMFRIRSGHTGTKAKPTQVLLRPSGNKAEEGPSLKKISSEGITSPSRTVQDILTDFDETLEQVDDVGPEQGNVTKEQSETLPGFRPNSTVYHDGKGYYFIFNALKENKRYLRCIDLRCRVRGSMYLYEGAPIRINGGTVHNHRPDFKRKNFVLFLQRCKERAAQETKPLPDIYSEEMRKDPLSAAMISSQNLLTRMSRARKMVTKYFPTDEDQSEFESACNSSALPTQVPANELMDEDSHSQGEAYHDIVAEAITEEDEGVDEDQEADAIEQAISGMHNAEQSSTSEEVFQDGGPVPEDEAQPSETLPGLRPHSNVFHDGRGYYYVYNTQRENVWYLKCIEPRCRVRAHMLPVDGSPIIQSPKSLHNHRPDFKRKRLVLWMERLKQLVISQPNTSIPAIYSQEAKRDPESASLVSEENMKTKLHRARKAHLPQTSETVDYQQLFSEDVKTETMIATEQVDYQQFFSEDVQTDTIVTTQQIENIKTEEEEGKSSIERTIEQVISDGLQGTLGNREISKEKPIKVQKKNPLSNVLSALVNYLSPNSGAVIEGGSQLTDDNQTVVMMSDSQVEDSKAVITIQGGEDGQEGNTVYLYQSSDNVTPQRPTFCDDKGYCYQQTTIRQSTRYLKCIESGCKARASMTLEENAAITLNKQSSHHNHDPDQSEFTMLLDPGHLVGDTTPIQVIYTDENGGEQVALCHISEDVHKRPYRQRQKPDITIDPEEVMDPKIYSEVDLAGGDYYHTEDQQKFPLKQSEVIPGLRPDANNYHDGNGFYYELNRLSQNIRYLKCLIKDCRARAYMEVGKENAPIIQTNFAKHNHGPDLFRKQFTVFLHRVTRRAAEEDTPINVIYQEEAQRDPHSASQIRMENVKQRMMRFRKKHRKARIFDYDNATGTDADMDYFFADADKDPLSSPSADRYYIHDEYEGDGQGEETYEKKFKVEEKLEEEEVDESSLYQDIVVSEVEIESSSQSLLQS